MLADEIFAPVEALPRRLEERMVDLRGPEIVAARPGPELRVDILDFKETQLWCKT